MDIHNTVRVCVYFVTEKIDLFVMSLLHWFYQKLSPKIQDTFLNKVPNLKVSLEISTTLNKH